MSIRHLASVLIAGLVLAGTASATSLDKGWDTGRITALDETSQSIAAGLAWTPRSCEGAVLWLPGLGDRYTFRVPGPCPATSTGRGVSAAAALGKRVVFLSYGGGNIREWRLWTVSTTSRRPRLIREVDADPDLPPPIVLGNAGDNGIPYAVGRDVVVLGSTGARIASWRAPAAVTALSAAANLIAATLANGDVDLFPTRGGAPVLNVPAGGRPVTGLRPVAGGVVVATAAGIDLYRPKGVTHLDVPRGARLAGDFDDQLVYVHGNEIRLYAHRTGADILLRRVAHPGLVDADRRGMAWTTGGRLCWTVRVGLTSRNALAPGCS